MSCVQYVSDSHRGWSIIFHTLFPPFSFKLPRQNWGNFFTCLAFKALKAFAEKVPIFLSLFFFLSLEKGLIWSSFLAAVFHCDTLCQGTSVTWSFMEKNIPFLNVPLCSPLQNTVFFFKKLNRNYQQCYGSQNIVGVMASSQLYKCYLKKEYKI